MRIRVIARPLRAPADRVAGREEHRRTRSQDRDRRAVPVGLGEPATGGDRDYRLGSRGSRRSWADSWSAGAASKLSCC
jgi:hypothetical protein